MEKLLNEIKLTYTDPEINALISGANNSSKSYSVHFNQNEELFVRLGQEFEVPQFPVHHDIEKKIPSKEYLGALKNFLNRVVPLAQDLFSDLTYFFDPTEILHPCFYQIYRLGDSLYLYLLRVDLIFKTNHATLLGTGSNDRTPPYRSRDLFIESDFIPLKNIETNGGKLHSFVILQTISQTWIGETGRGYFLQGIWMDNDLNKFFTKLFLPPGKRIYPFYPFTCKFRTFCMTAPQFGPEDRKRFLPYLHKALQVVTPKMEEIQNALRNVPFSEDIGTYQELKKTIPQPLVSLWSNLKITPYLNEANMKEFHLEI